MKKIILTLALFVFMAGALRAQAEGKTIGLRIGYPTDISFQLGLNNSNRIELGLGFRTYGYSINTNNKYSQISLSGVYQWVWDLSALSSGFNWYAGGGASIGHYSYTYASTDHSGFPVSVLGEIGLEYNLSIPLRLSIDWRPVFQFNAFGNGFIGDSFGIGIRYRF